MTGVRQMTARVPAVLSLLVISAAAIAPALGADSSGNAAQKPFRIIGNTYYVGTAGAAAVLVTSEYGHTLINGGSPEAAAQIATNIESLGFKVTDVKGILVTEPARSQSGAIAALASRSGAQVYGSRPAEKVMTTGKPERDDPNAAGWKAFDPVTRLWVVQDDQLLGIGSVRLRAYVTAGRSPGGMSWRWDACEGSSCVDTVFVTNLAPVSSPKYRFKDHPEVLAAYETGLARLEGTSCELALPAVPDAALLARLAAAAGNVDSLKQVGACKAHVQQAREALQTRLASER